MLDIDQAIRNAQAQIIHKNMPSAAVGGLMIAAICVTVFWRVAPQHLLLVWFGVMAVLVGVRMLRWNGYRGPRLLQRGADRWLRETAVSSGITGLMWMAGSTFMMPPDQLPSQLSFSFALFAISVSAMFSYNVHYPTFLAFFTPTILSGVVGLALQQTLLTSGVALGIFLFSLVALHGMWGLNRAFVDAQKLRFENTDLVEQLTIQKNAAVSANLAKSRFLAAASHDLRQPMHALSLYLATLQSHPLPAETRPVLDNVGQCAQTMEKMFSELLDISRLDAGAVQPEPEDFPMVLLFDRLRVEFEPLARAKGLVLRVVPCGAFVRSDPVLLGRILRNLVANAVRYTTTGKVLVGCRRQHGQLRIEVHDTGPGVAPEYMHKIFEEFYQIAPSREAHAGGLGLGLAIVDRLSRLLPARLAWHSRPGHGSVFSVDVPLVAAAVPVPVPATLPPRQGPQDFSGSLVVVIDDNPQVLEATRVLLASWGCEVVVAASGAQALAQFAHSPRVPQALVCDYRLQGGESGIAVVERLRSEFNEPLPALLITGDTGPEQILEIAASGLPVLYKPLRTEALRAQLDQLLVGAGARAVSVASGT